MPTQTWDGTMSGKDLAARREAERRRMLDRRTPNYKAAGTVLTLIVGVLILAGFGWWASYQLSCTKLSTTHPTYCTSK